MNHNLDNIFDEEDYRHKVYSLYKQYESGDLSSDQLKENLHACYQELVDGATSKNLQLVESKNPFCALWDKALQNMNSSEYEASIRQIQNCWSDFMDYYFSMWYLRRTEELLGMESKPLI